MPSGPQPEHYRALVDIGSNGIRFSISDLSPPSARILPTVYQDRCPISLYDAQYEAGRKVPISDLVIQEVLSALLRFKRICSDLRIRSHGQVQVVATEALRTAVNGKSILTRIEERLQWKPQLLSKEEEGRFGAMGVTSSVSDLEGLLMDMGGGSLQMTYQIQGESFDPKKSVSLPFGAAALMARMQEASISGTGDGLFNTMVQRLSSSLRDFSISRDQSLALYLSGGGFRGWGHILMSVDSVQPYPIPIVNGYSVDCSQLIDAVDGSKVSSKTHRISKRRASQAKAVHLLMKALVQALGDIAVIHKVVFCQGGIREGMLYSELPTEIKSQHPLVAATAAYAPESASQLLGWLTAALPQGPPMSGVILNAAVNLLYAHTSNPKDIRCSAALRCTTTGILSGAHGLLHDERALLALILCERWGRDVPPTDLEFLHRLQALVGPRLSWWAKYTGQVAGYLADLYPVGIVHPNEKPIEILHQLDTATDESLKLQVLSYCKQDLPQAESWVEGLTRLNKKTSLEAAALHGILTVDVSLVDKTDTSG